MIGVSFNILDALDNAYEDFSRNYQDKSVTEMLELFTEYCGKEYGINFKYSIMTNAFEYFTITDEESYLIFTIKYLYAT